MSSEEGSEPVGWGASFDRFGSDSSVDAVDGDALPRRSPSRGQGLTRTTSSSFGARAAGGAGRGAPRSVVRGRTSSRSSADDPFGPVVGSSADGDAPADGSADRAGRSQGRSRRRNTARGSGAAAAPAPDTRGEGGSPPPRTDEEWTSQARSILLRQLALGPRSRHQLLQKLAEREVPPAIATALLDRFEEVQLIDDAEFARMWVRTRTAAKALSRYSLRRELADKGIEPDLAEEALQQVTDEDEHLQARDVVRRKLRSSADLSDRAVRDKEVRRLVGVLARKGYNPGAAFSIVKEVLADTGTPD